MAGNTNTPKTRKPHKKSRSGCLPCKARHVKCDEQRPSCVNCNKYGTRCEYPRPRSTHSSHDVHSPALLDTPSSSQSFVPSPPNPELLVDGGQDVALNIPQLRLLHHFTTVTAKTLAHEPDVEDVFSSYYVNVAFEYPFLLQSLLALAALHLGRLQPNFRSEYLLQAERHNRAALTQFRVEVTDIDESNIQPVLAFSTSLFTYSWAISADSGNDIEHAFDSIVSNLMLTRRVRPIIQLKGLYDAMRQSELGRLIPKDVIGQDWLNCVPSEDTELVQLRKFSEVIHHVYPPDIIEPYKEAINFLTILFELTSKSPGPPSDSLLRLWVHHVPPRFIELLSEKQPGALIIFAHYGVLIGRSRQYWFLEGVDELILNVAEHFVPTEWKSWLDWPKEKINRAHTSPIAGA